MPQKREKKNFKSVMIAKIRIDRAAQPGITESQIEALIDTCQNPKKAASFHVSSVHFFFSSAKKILKINQEKIRLLKFFKEEIESEDCTCLGE